MSLESSHHPTFHWDCFQSGFGEQQLDQLREKYISQIFCFFLFLTDTTFRYCSFSAASFLSLQFLLLSSACPVSWLFFFCLFFWAETPCINQKYARFSANSLLGNTLLVQIILSDCIITQPWFTEKAANVKKPQTK